MFFKHPFVSQLYLLDVMVGKRASAEYLNCKQLLRQKTSVTVYGAIKHLPTTVAAPQSLNWPRALQDKKKKKKSTENNL